ncbi:MAG: [FeFe] hydrogenase H-cluster maturation GTPase HydF [Candidatus Omnitrophota bacterium]
MYKTPASNRLHIGIFGRRNSGKSSLINALTGQNLAIVSDIAGTTTDPVYKAMEILPIGPCILIDTAGIDDEGALGKERIKKTQGVIRKSDVGLIVLDSLLGEITDFERGLARLFEEKKMSFMFVVNKSDLKKSPDLIKQIKEQGFECIEVSSKTDYGIAELKNEIIRLSPKNWSPVPLVRDIIKPQDVVVLVCPIDSAMPQGRLILPQVQVLRDVLDANATAFVCKETELKELLGKLNKKPNLVITDSQVFDYVSEIVPEDIPLTSFSVIFARHKGDLNAFIEGVRAVDKLKDGDEILIAEACTHHVQPEDIGRAKIPTWLINHTKKDLHFDVTAGGDFPDSLERYSLIITCGGCMVNRREVLYRVNKAGEQAVAITNYGIIIAYFAGVLDRIIKPFSVGIVDINVKN